MELESGDYSAPEVLRSVALSIYAESVKMKDKVLSLFDSKSSILSFFGLLSKMMEKNLFSKNIP